MIKDFILQNDKVDELISEGLYDEAAELLFNSQLDSWEFMRKNYAVLKNVKVRSFWYESSKFKVQFNPQRIKSTSADVSKDRLKERLCFLCIENLPMEQKGLLLNDNHVLLCNPYPIFPQHFTISSLQHEPQGIRGNIKELLEITKLLSKKYTLIYNGPDCGASAPDHLHFQAGTKLLMPIENDIYQIKNDFGEIIFSDAGNTVMSIKDGLRSILFIEALDINLAANLFDKFYKCYSTYTSASGEPLLNLLCGYDEEFGFNLMVFLRSKHRPESFFENGTEKIMISPAAVDLAGLLITPRQEDFNKLNKGLIQTLISEVSLEHSSFGEFAEILKNELN